MNALRYVARLVDQGYTDSEISEALGKRYRPVTPKTIDVSDAPMKGNPKARITLVEFADYECPHCKRFQPVLHQILDEFPNDVRVYFKHYPLPQHTNARLAAEGAVAAQKQGKFWQFQDKLWEHQDELSPAEIEKVAKEAGLDVAEVPPGPRPPKPVKAKVQKDRNDGSAIGLQATPTLYIDGREYTDSQRHREPPRMDQGRAGQADAAPARDPLAGGSRRAGAGGLPDAGVRHWVGRSRVWWGHAHVGRRRPRSWWTG